MISDNDWHGFGDITVIVTDGELIDTETFTLVVTPVNDFPTIVQGENQTMLEDAVAIYSFEIADIDTGETLTLDAYTDTSAVTVTVDNIDYSITAIPEPDWHGTCEVMVVVTDQFLTDTTIFSLTVDPVNDAPIIQQAEDQSIAEDEFGTYSFEVSDIDTGETLFLNAFSDTSSISILVNSTNVSITATPDTNWHGNSDIFVIVSDGYLTDTTTFSFTVNPLNDAPVILSIQDTIINENGSLYLNLEIVDVDTNETLTLFASSDISSLDLTVNDQDSSLTITPSANWNGTSEIFIRVSDGELTDSTNFTLTVLSINNPPSIEPAENQNMLEDYVGTYYFEVADIDTGQVLSLTAYSDTNAVVLSANSDDFTISIEPTLNWNGSSEITVVVSDDFSTDTTSFIITIDPVNDHPIIANIENQSVSEDSSITIVYDISDVDTGTVFMMYVVPDTSSIQVVTNLNDYSFSATPVEDWSGSSEVKVIVSDGELTDTTLFTLTVNPVNDAPIISQLEDQSIIEDTEGQYVYEIIDIDSEVLGFISFSDTNAVSISVDTENYSINCTPRVNWYGTSQITTIISDGFLSDTASFELTVEYVSDKPFAVLGDDIFSMQGQKMKIDGSDSYDIDNESLEYYWISPNLLEDTVITIQPYLEFESPQVEYLQPFLIKLYVLNEFDIQSDLDSLYLFVDFLQVNDILPGDKEIISEVGEDIPIAVNFPDYFNVDSISMNYSTAFSGFISTPMENVGSRSQTNFSADIPFHDAGLEGLVYYVYASDEDGNVIITDTTNIQVSFGDGIVTSEMAYSPFSNGFPKDVWRMISVPSSVDQSQIDNIFNVPLNGEPSNTSWMIYEWRVGVDAFGNTFIDGWQIPDSVEAGKSYWLKQFISDDISFSVSSGKTVELTGFDMPIQGGWNLISSPYLFPVSIDLDENDFSDLFIFGTDTLEGWVDTKVTTLEPWKGYAIYSYNTDNRTIRLNPLELNEQNSAARSTQEDGWSLNIAAKSGKFIDGKNRFGMSLNAKNKIDNLDFPEPPVFDQYISLYSTSIDENNKKIKNTYDYRSLSDSLHIWNLDLKSNLRDSQARLDFNLQGNIGLENVIWFIDMQDGQKIELENIRIQSLPINIEEYNSVSQFKLIYGTLANVSQVYEDVLKLIPSKFSLGNNYPNPFNPTTTIPFSIAQPSNVSLKIYDVQGREVKQIYNGYLGTGYYNQEWSGDNNMGTSVSSGVYYYGLVTKNFQKYKKLILIK